MNNTFHEIERAIGEDSIDSREAIRALLATIYLECCENCGSRLRSEEFRAALKHMLQELKVCHELSTKNAA